MAPICPLVLPVVVILGHFYLFTLLYLFIDAFFSALHLMQGFTAFQLHTFKESQCECMSLMKFKSQIPQSLLDLSGDVGAPTVLVKDGAKEMMGADWL